MGLVLLPTEIPGQKPKMDKHLPGAVSHCEGDSTAQLCHTALKEVRATSGAWEQVEDLFVANIRVMAKTIIG